jgi:hypothetical protein
MKIQLINPHFAYFRAIGKLPGTNTVLLGFVGQTESQRKSTIPKT